MNQVGEVTNDNITPELYERLLHISAAHADFFHEVEVTEPQPKAKKTKSETTKPESNGNDIQA